MGPYREQAQRSEVHGKRWGVTYLAKLKVRFLQRIGYLPAIKLKKWSKEFRRLSEENKRIKEDYERYLERLPEPPPLPPLPPLPPFSSLPPLPPLPPIDFIGFDELPPLPGKGRGRK